MSIVEDGSAVPATSRTKAPLKTVVHEFSEQSLPIDTSFAGGQVIIEAAVVVVGVNHLQMPG